MTEESEAADPGLPAVKRPAVLDATTLWYFSYAGADVLRGMECVTTRAVRDELARKRDEGNDHLDAVLDAMDAPEPVAEREAADLAGVARYGSARRTIPVVEPGEQAKRTRDEFAESRSIDDGEAEALAVAVENDGTLVTDDESARKLAAQLGRPVNGSVSVLHAVVERTPLDRETAEGLLDEWRDRNGRLPLPDRGTSLDKWHDVIDTLDPEYPPQVPDQSPVESASECLVVRLTDPEAERIAEGVDPPGASEDRAGRTDGADGEGEDHGGGGRSSGRG